MPLITSFEELAQYLKYLNLRVEEVEAKNDKLETELIEKETVISLLEEKLESLGVV